MSAEQVPRPETLRDVMLAGRSLADWYLYLITDAETGENNGYLETPASRYGSRSEQCAWWAVAVGVIYEQASEVDDMAGLLDQAHGLAANDHPDVATLVIDYAWCLPECLKEALGGDDELLRMVEEGGA